MPAKKPIRMWKVVYGEPSPRQVTAETPCYPNDDSEGATIYENTHFTDQRTAWKKHLAEHKAGMSLGTRRAAEARLESLRRDKECADAAIAYQAALDAHADSERERPGEWQREQPSSSEPAR